MRTLHKNSFSKNQSDIPRGIMRTNFHNMGFPGVGYPSAKRKLARDRYSSGEISAARKPGSIPAVSSAQPSRSGVNGASRNLDVAAMRFLRCVKNVLTSCCRVLMSASWVAFSRLHQVLADGEQRRQLERKRCRATALQRKFHDSNFNVPECSSDKSVFFGRPILPKPRIV